MAGSGIAVRANGDPVLADIANPKVRAVMRALNATGHYREDPEDFDWIRADAGTVLAHAPGGNPAGIVAALVDAGLHEAGEACLQTDLAHITTAFDRIGRWA